MNAHFWTGKLQESLSCPPAEGVLEEQEHVKQCPVIIPNQVFTGRWMSQAAVNKDEGMSTFIIAHKVGNRRW